jgi:MFS family permease
MQASCDAGGVASVAPDTPDLPSRRPSPSSFSRRAFRTLWTASASGNLGDGLFKTALPVIAVRLTDSATLVAGVTFAMTLPWALCALPAGVIVDRLDRRRLMVMASTGRVAALSLLGAAAVTHVAELPTLYLTGFTLGACETVFDTAAGAILPAIVPRERLEWANARLLAAETLLNEFGGPPLAGLLLAVGAVVAVGASAVTYLVVVFAMGLLPGSFQIKRDASSRILADLGEGLRFVWRQPVLRTLALMTAVMAGAWSAWQAVLVLFAIHGPLHLSTVTYGLLLSLLAVGGLLGTLLASRAQRRLGTRAVIGADVLATATMLATPALSTNLYAVAAATLIGGAGSGMWNVVVLSLGQRITPDALLGRVRATSRLLGWGTMPLGAALGGVLAQLAGVQTVFAVGAILSALLVIPLFRVMTPGRLAQSTQA